MYASCTHRWQPDCPGRRWMLAVTRQKSEHPGGVRQRRGPAGRRRADPSRPVPGGAGPSDCPWRTASTAPARPCWVADPADRSGQKRPGSARGVVARGGVARDGRGECLRRPVATRTLGGGRGMGRRGAPDPGLTSAQARTHDPRREVLRSATNPQDQDEDHAHGAQRDAKGKDDAAGQFVAVAAHGRAL